MTIPQSAKAADASLGRDRLSAARYYFGGRRGILVLAVITVLAGIGLSWNWLVAAGIAPILLTALPCLVMCGAGLCMNKLIGGSCASNAQAKTTEASQPDAPSNVVSIHNTAPADTVCCQADSTENRSMNPQPITQRRDINA